MNAGDNGEGGGGSGGGRPFTVAAYVPEYRLGHVHDHTDFLLPRLTDVLLFSVEPTLDGGGLQALDRVLWDGRVPERFRRPATAAASAARPRFSVCIGGAGRSENFRAAAASDEARRKFAHAVRAFVEEHDLDGVDIDWEGQFSVGTMEALLQALADELRQPGTGHGGSNNGTRSFRLTVALHHFTPLSARGYAAVDAVHLMAYDLHGGPGGHSSMAHSQQVARAIMDSGCPASKIVLGLPAYSRRVNRPGEVKTYAELVDTDRANALRDETPDGHAYNGVATVRAKTRWAREVGLGGVMLWEAGQDTIDVATSLIVAMHDEAGAGAGARAGDSAAASRGGDGGSENQQQRQHRKKKKKKKKKKTQARAEL